MDQGDLGQSVPELRWIDPRVVMFEGRLDHRPEGRPAKSRRCVVGLPESDFARTRRRSVSFDSWLEVCSRCGRFARARLRLHVSFDSLPDDRLARRRLGTVSFGTVISP